ncbi:hypothetical protein FEM48_Zijuj01G0123500 [Ziziphus jujuba var. spinosa]|uniref:Uncharacterized protein n=1 Tax=Ziziphus jujuba var. spinosa TaxID=714518 RepID=A0A978W185_ZIZJJ|nr:hypothetical protein FEM48_Zijuj01G0123500 [Ziziphus jujuba var. spinosa]
MATLQASSIFCLKGKSSLQVIHFCKGSVIRATNTNNNAQKTQATLPPLSSFPSRTLSEGLDIGSTGSTINAVTTTQTEKHSLNFSTSNTNTTCSIKQSEELSNRIAVSKLHAIMEAVADRVEMHNNIGAQRDNWNRLLLTSINAITLTAATMAGIASAISGTGAPFMALKLSSTILYLAATGMLVVMNKIQPSQLAEEQRNAARLFKQLRIQIRTTLSLGNPTSVDVNEAMDKVLALDKAYPLPLLGNRMLERFPDTVEPTVWWPRKQRDRQQADYQERGGIRKEVENGWSREMEEEMREIVGVIERKDMVDYLSLSRKALGVNRILAISGPLLTGFGALGCAFVGIIHGAWPVVVGVVAGAMASVVNALEHGGQVGMVFEMYRSNAGFFRLMEETIESNLNEKDAGRRENGEVLEMKVALQLGRSLSELKHLSSSSRNGEAPEEFASKLF